MPFQAPPVATEKDALHAYVLQQQDAFRAAVFGLTDDQAGRAASASTLTPGTLVKHVTATQRSWLDSVLAAPELPVDDRTQEQQYADWQTQFTWLPGDTVADVLAAFDAVSGEVLDAIRDADLDTAVPVPPAPWNPRDIEAWSVRWVWFHLIEELARHAGHADIVRESLDGATMYPLVAAREGFPATPWLTPWSPEDA
ncbi:MAG: DinB family protein [Nocardioidaceae bacterium]